MTRLFGDEGMNSIISHGLYMINDAMDHGEHRDRVLTLTHVTCKLMLTNQNTN